MSDVLGGRNEDEAPDGLLTPSRLKVLQKLIRPSCQVARLHAPPALARSALETASVQSLGDGVETELGFATNAEECGPVQMALQAEELRRQSLKPLRMRVHLVQRRRAREVHRRSEGREISHSCPGNPLIGSDSVPPVERVFDG